MKQNGVARLHGVGLFEQVLHSQALEHDRRGLFEADGVGQFDQIGFGQHMHFAVGTQRAPGIGDTVADLEPGDMSTDRLDYPGTFRAQPRRQCRRRVQAAAKVSIDKVQADGLVAYADLLRTGCGRFEIDQLQDLRAPMLAELDTLGHLHSPVGLGKPLSDAFA
ncbi:hypothetical protein D3C72_1752910 [compost metagenome]